ncbi:PAS domain S-box protein [Patescibacteria group bacterium]
MSNKGKFPISMFYAVLKYFPISFYFKDRDGNFVAVSRTKAANSNVSVEEMLGVNDSHFLPPNEAKKSFVDDMRVIELNETIENEEEKLTRPDGSESWVSVTKAPWVEDNQIKGVVGIAIDITERKKAEEERNEAEEKLNMLNEKLITFLRSAKHDVINKLIAIKRIVRDLQKNRLENVDIAYNEILKVNMQIEKIISGYLTDPSMERFPIPDKEICDVSTDIIEPIREEYSQESDKNDIHIDNTLGGISADEVIVTKEECRILEIIFRNLLGNAMKFSGKGTKIAIGYEMSDGLIKFNVFNTGPAVPKELEEDIFKPGYTTGDGMGDGLSNCRKLAQLGGGDLIYETTESGHPNFIIVWPKKNEGNSNE